MQSRPIRHHRPFSQQGPFNPEYDYESHHPYRFYIKAEPTSNKQTPNAKHSFDRHHRSTKHLHRKHEVTQDVSQHFTQNLRERRIKSSSKNKTDNSDTESNSYDQYFGRITMHCLRKRREIFQKNSHCLQSEYSYLVKKIERLQKSKQSEQSKQKQHQLIQFKRKRELSSLQIVKASNDSLLMRRKEELKDQVLSHRANKVQNVMAVKEQKLRVGDEVRMQESHLHEELIHIHQSRIQQNKVKYQRGKAEKLRRQRRIKSELEEKQMVARENFRHRWIDEYERQEAAKDEYQRKKDVFERKIREAMDIYKKIEGE